MHGHYAHLRWGATRARALGARAMRKRLGPSGDLVSFLFGKFRLPIKEKAPPRQLSASGAASVFQRDPPTTPVHLHECVCPLGIATTRVRRGLLLKIPTAYDSENFELTKLGRASG